MFIIWCQKTFSHMVPENVHHMVQKNRVTLVYQDFTGSSIEGLPIDVQNLIDQQNAAMTIQGYAKKMDAKRSLIDELKVRAYTIYQRAGRNRENMHYIKKLWTNLVS